MFSFADAEKESVMKHYLLILRITFIVLGIFFIFMLVLALNNLKEGKAYRARCTETTEGTVTYFSKIKGGRHHSSETTLAYKFKLKGFEYTADHKYGKNYSNMNYSKGDRITVHYNPDKPYENYADRFCYHEEVAKERLSIVGIVWAVYLIFLTIHIVTSVRSPEKFYY